MITTQERIRRLKTPVEFRAGTRLLWYGQANNQPVDVILIEDQGDRIKFAYIVENQIELNGHAKSFFTTPDGYIVKGTNLGYTPGWVGKEIARLENIVEEELVARPGMIVYIGPNRTGPRLVLSSKAHTRLSSGVDLKWSIPTAWTFLGDEMIYSNKGTEYYNEYGRKYVRYEDD